MTRGVEKLSESPPPLSRKNGPLGTGGKGNLVSFNFLDLEPPRLKMRTVAPSASLTQISFQYLAWPSV